MRVKLFKCGLCKGERYIGTRYGLRKHLKEEHRIMSRLTNSSGEKKKKIKQRWWITEDFN